jgi:tetrahydromethanopterin S-methyltransferase subunit G
MKMFDSGMQRQLEQAQKRLDELEKRIQKLEHA